MDCTSENDFIIKSYIIEKYDSLTSQQKDDLSQTVLDYFEKKVIPYKINIETTIKDLQEKGITNINKFIKLPST